jgi:hypothetical protein
MSLLDSIQGLADMPPRQRYRLLGWCYLRSFLDWRTWASIFLTVAFAIGGQIAVRYALPELTTRHAPLFGFSGAFVAWLVGSYVSSKIRSGVVRKLVRSHFPNLCKDCGYDLRGCAGRCPECGNEPH